MTLLMVSASTGPLFEGDAGFCLGVRFCTVEDVAHVEDLLIKQIRKNHRTYANKKPREIRRLIAFDVYEVPDPPTRGGWPKWLGETAWYK